MQKMHAITLLLALTLTIGQQIAAQPLQAPKVPRNLDKQYRTLGESREVVTYMRSSDHMCTYPDDKFGCKSIVGLNVTVSVQQCNVCTWMAIGFGKQVNSGGAFFCAEDGSSYIKVHYTDRECQVPGPESPYPYERYPSEEVKTATASEPSCNVLGNCSAEVPPVYCDTRILSRECSDDFKCDHNPPACTGGCCPPAGGSGSESLHLELAYWKIREQKYACSSDGSCTDNSLAGAGGTLANCRSACEKPSDGRYACVDGHCVPCGDDCSGVSLAECQTVCPAGNMALGSVAALQV